MKLTSLHFDIIKAILFLTSIYSLFLEIRLLTQGVFTEGKIIGFNCNLPILSDKFCFPIVRFTTKDNKIITYQYNFNQALIYQAKKGDRADLIYNEQSPQNVVLNDVFDKWFDFILGFLTGALAVIPIKWFKLLDLF